MKSLRYMLVEDQPADQFYTKVLIESHQPDCSLTVADDGERALEILEQQNVVIEGETPGPDVILLDINMPRMDGFEFLEEFTSRVQRGELRQRPVIIMLTSSDDVSDRTRASRFSCVKGYLTKPIDLKRLDGTLTTVLAERDGDDG
ncbi:response regulator [uncultured Abyssibacter sp.]|uniref:response regulator n=1 Tax=uncultured Abyssibacter sp. TaxID=2320202 RepID=UPI0032B16679